MKKTILKFFGEDPQLAEHMGPLHWLVFLVMLSAAGTLVTVLSWGMAMVIL